MEKGMLKGKLNAMLKYVLSLMLLGVFVSNVHAGSLVCSGNVDMLAYHQGAGLLVKLSSMNEHVFICSTDNEWIVPGSLAGNTSPAACKTLYSTFLLARTTGTPIKNMVFDGNAVPAACNSFAPWTSVNVRYYYY